jgi:hypothetical protein
MRVDLRSFRSEDRLWNTIFGSAEFEAWRQGEYLLYLFLDSFDECLLRIDNVATLIGDQLPSEPTKRLRLRIACRTAQWPDILENSLIRAFGSDAFEAYELAPLRRRDVVQALTKSGITTQEEFFARVDALEVSSFAIKPVTLKFLIETYRRDGNLPSNQFDLYERGCRILCEEVNESRRASGKLGALTVDQRFGVASRVAAITQLCNRYAVNVDTEAGVILSEDVAVREIADPGNGGLVTPSAVREVLDTGLFSSRGAKRIGWAHQTCSEFLAAQHCVGPNMSTKQLSSLLFHPAGGAQRLIPQLCELAAWICIKRDDLLRLVAETDPEALLGSAGASLDESQRELVVQSLLKQSENGRLLNFRWNLYGLYPKLAHPGLTDSCGPTYWIEIGV